MERRREQNQREQRLLRSNERGFRGVGSVVQLEDPADATDCLDDFIKLIEEICNVYPEQGRGLISRIGTRTSNSNSGNGSMANVNVGNVENTTLEMVGKYFSLSMGQNKFS